MSNPPLPLTALTAITPIDGRYGSKVESLRAIFSEYGLIHARVLVEIRWLQQLANHAQISELPSFSAQANTQLEQVLHSFNTTQQIDDLLDTLKKFPVPQPA